MKAITMTQFGDSDVLEYRDVDLPGVMAKEVRVRVKAAGVNPSEAYVRTGNYAFYKPDLPFTPGFDGAGIVEEVGSDVKDLKEGDRVFIGALLADHNTGTYAEEVVCDAGVVHPLPDAISFEEGAALGVAGVTAYRALFQRGRLQPGETVLIHGASGGVGIIAVQIATAIGATVIGTASSEEGRALVKEAGAKHAINHISEDTKDDFLALTEGNGADLVIEMLANVNLETDLHVLTKYGRVVIVGNRGSLDFNPRLAMGKEADILGMAVWNAKPEEYSESLHAVRGFLEAGIIKPFVGDRLPLSQAAKAQDLVLDNQSKGRMILTID